MTLRAHAEKLASELRALVIADVTTGAFDDTRAPYDAHLARIESMQCSHYSVLAEPGEVFRIHSAWGWDGRNFRGPATRTIESSCLLAAARKRGYLASGRGFLAAA
jgi:hypothetical protein